MSEKKGSHIPVLMRETVDPLVKNGGENYVDGTLGGGGHLHYLLSLLAARPSARVFAMDRDEEAVERVKERFRVLIDEGRLVIRQGNFTDLPQFLGEYNIECVSGVLLDLGVSSFQLDQGERGFSFSKDGPLDMRMDRTRGVSAQEIIAKWSADDLKRIFQKYGEERYSGRVARRIVEYREKTPIETTGQLTGILTKAVPSRGPKGYYKIHPATRVFQALRIAVNGELESLEKFLELVPDILEPNGVMSIISFHSLEDRLVKQRFHHLSADCVCPLEVLTCDRCHKPPGVLPSKKLIVATREEILENPRARSAKLRVFVKN